MNSAQFERLPHFVKTEMESISKKIRPIMKKVSTYYLMSFPFMLIGIFNILLYVFNNDVTMSGYLVPIVYALFAAVGLALFNESRLLKKEIHQVGKNHIIERIRKSKLMEDEEKNQYITSVKNQAKIDLQPFFRFLTEENRRNHEHFFK